MEATDRDLISAHVQGDPDAFATLFDRHRDRLWAVALRTTGNPEDAADGLQEALISAFRGASNYRGEAAVTTWLHRIVVNACLDRLRRRRVRPTVPLPGQDEDSGPDTLADPSEPLHALELAIEIDRAMAALPEEQRLAIALVDVQGYRVDEAAQMLGVPAGTVKSRCSRGRAKLAVTLAPLRPGVRGGNPDASGAVSPQEADQEGGDA